jgi:hypothetical protein
VYGGICTEAYYGSAARYLEEKYGSCHFYIFSNDPAWVRENAPGIFGALPVTVMDANGEKEGWKDMYLISLCRHHIIANSSFSWWGAWLSGDPDREIVSPARFINGCECPDIRTDRMTLMDETGKIVKGIGK